MVTSQVDQPKVAATPSNGHTQVQNHQVTTNTQPVKRGRGRPKGSLSSKTIQRQLDKPSQVTPQEAGAYPQNTQVVSPRSNTVIQTQSSRYEGLLSKQSKVKVADTKIVPTQKTLNHSANIGRPDQVKKQPIQNQPTTSQTQHTANLQSTTPSRNKVTKGGQQPRRHLSSPSLIKGIQDLKITNTSSSKANHTTRQNPTDEESKQVNQPQQSINSPVKKFMKLQLTPIMEDLAELCLSSNAKKYRDDTLIKNRSQSKLRVVNDNHTNDEEVKQQLTQIFSNIPIDTLDQNEQIINTNQRSQDEIKIAKEQYRQQLGKYGTKTLDLSMKKSSIKKQQYSMSLIAAITPESVLSVQVIEGTVDSSLFQKFMFDTLKYVRSSQGMAKKDVILLMDNAVIHKHSSVLETTRNFKVNVLFNAEYSPWLNPIEQLFGYIKRSIKTETIDSKESFVKQLEKVIKTMKEDDVKGLWTFSMKKWVETMKYGHV